MTREASGAQFEIKVDGLVRVNPGLPVLAEIGNLQRCVASAGAASSGPRAQFSLCPSGETWFSQIGRRPMTFRRMIWTFAAIAAIGTTAAFGAVRGGSAFDEPGGPSRGAREPTDRLAQKGGGGGGFGGASHGGDQSSKGSGAPVIINSTTNAGSREGGGGVRTVPSRGGPTAQKVKPAAPPKKPLDPKCVAAVIAACNAKCPFAASDQGGSYPAGVMRFQRVSNQRCHDKCNSISPEGLDQCRKP
jgi:hypothetical protein